MERWNPGRTSDEELEFLARAAKRLHEETEYAVCGWFSGSLMEYSQQARGWDRFMMDLLADPPFASLLIEKLAQKHLANLGQRWQM